MIVSMESIDTRFLATWQHFKRRGHVM